MKKMRIFWYAVLLSSLSAIYSCASLFQLDEISNCEFEFQTISDLHIGKINIQNTDNFSDLNFVDAGLILKDFMDGAFPVSFTSNISINNPNKRKAVVNKIEWILYIDNKEVSSGSIDTKTIVKANKSEVVSQKIELDLIKAMNSKNQDKLVKLVFDLKNEKDIPQNAYFKIKPSILISGKEVKYQGYVYAKPKTETENLTQK